MKKIIFLIHALVGMLTMATESTAQLYIVRNGTIVYSLEEGTVDYIALERPIKTDFIGEAVDMGLSVKWSSVNLGARSPEELGVHVAWGETEAKDEYTWLRYELGSWQEGIRKYQFPDEHFGGCWYAHNFVGDNKTILDLEDDAAHVNWGGDWVMPSPDDFEELEKHCACEWTTQEGVNGYKITGANSNSIFLPAAGYRNYGFPNGEGSYGYYWSSSLDESFSRLGRRLNFYEGDFIPWVSYDRYDGVSVRPVCPSAGDTNGHVAVDLGLPSGKLWASCNVGASAPEASGWYIAWGETEAKEFYAWSTYKHIKDNASPSWTDINKYTIADGSYSGIWYEGGEFIGDGKTTLEAEDDAATVNWGDSWRMPTAKEWEELTNEENCTWTWRKVNGVNGYEVLSKITGNSIFLPAAGKRYYDCLRSKGEDGFYWSSSLLEKNTQLGGYMYFGSGSFGIGYESRYNGFSVRPVCPVQE